MNAPSRGMRQPPVRRRAALPATRQPVALSDTRTTIPCPALARRARSRVRGGRGVGNAAVRRAPIVRARRARWRTSRAAAGRGDRRDRAFRSTAFGPMSSGGRALAPGPQLGASALSRRSVDVSVAATSVRSCRSPPTRSTPSCREVAPEGLRPPSTLRSPCTATGRVVQHPSSRSDGRHQIALADGVRQQGVDEVRFLVLAAP